MLGVNSHFKLRKELYKKLFKRSSKGMDILKYRNAFFLVLLTLTSVSCDDERERLKDHATSTCGKSGFFEASDGAFCCLCSPGTYLLKPCNYTDQPYKTDCKNCTFDADDVNNQTFMPDQNNKTSCYEALKDCDSFMNTHRVDGSSTENSRCVCNPGYHSANHTGDVAGGCHKHSPCEEGFQPLRLADEKHDTLCEVCENGTFSNVSSPTAKCIQFTVCGFNKTETLGNTTHDSSCTTNSTDDSTPSPLKTDGSNTGAIVGSIFGVIFAILILGIILYCYRKKKNAFANVELQQRGSSNGVGHGNDDEIRSGVADPLLPRVQAAGADEVVQAAPRSSNIDGQLQVALPPEEQLGDGMSYIDEPDQTDESGLLLVDDAKKNTSTGTSQSSIVEQFIEDRSEQQNQAGPIQDKASARSSQNRLEYSPFQNGSGGGTSTQQPVDNDADPAVNTASNQPSSIARTEQRTSNGAQDGEAHGDIPTTNGRTSQAPSDQTTQNTYNDDSETKNQAAPIPEETTRQRELSDYINELGLFSDDEKGDIQKTECCHQDLDEALKNHEIAQSMLKELPRREGDTEVRELCLKLGLSQIDVDDIDKEERTEGRKRVREKWVNKLIQILGRKLVPEQIFRLDYTSNGALKDTLFEKFLKELKSHL